MSDDLPQPSTNNPFIRFKRHVDSRIGTGLSILTGTSSGTDSATTCTGSKSTKDMDGAPKPSAFMSLPDQSLDWRTEAFVHTHTFRYWNEWTLLSPYSPYNLRQLPRPIPAGVSSKDAGLFDFGDAFEDLLAVSSGRGLMNLDERAGRKRAMLDLFQLGVPPIYWVNSLWSKRLLPQPLPVSPQMAATEAWACRRDQGSDILKRVEEHQQKLKAVDNQRGAPDDDLPSYQWRKQHLQSLQDRMLKELDDPVSFNPFQMISQIEDMMKRLESLSETPDPRVKTFRERMLKEPENNSTCNPEKKLGQAEQEAQHADWNDFDFDAYLEGKKGCAPTAKQNSQTQRNMQSQQNSEPDTEEELFSAFSDVFAEVEKALPTRSRAEELPKDEVVRFQKPVEVVEHDEDGGRTYTTATEHVDMFGRTHQKFEVRKVNANGDQISYESKLIVRPLVVTELQKSLEERENDSVASFPQGQENNTSKVNKAKSTGWFWR